MQSNDAEDEHKRQDQHNDGIDLQTGRLVRVKLCATVFISAMDFLSVVWWTWSGHVLSIVLLLPPAPAALVLLGLALAIFSFWSAAARRRIAVRGPPGGVGDEGRATLEPVLTGAPAGELARGDDYTATHQVC